MLTQDDLLALMTKHFPIEVSLIGRSNLETVVENFVTLGPSETNFQKPVGGHNSDTIAEMALVISILQLLLSISDIVVREVRQRREVEEQRCKEISAESLIEVVRQKLGREELLLMNGKEARLLLDLADIARRHER